MRKNIIISVLIAFNLLLIILSSSFLFKKSNDIEMISAQDKMRNLSNNIYAGEIMYLNSLMENGKKLDLNKVFYDTSMKSISIKDFFVDDSVRYFVFIPSLGCHTCLSDVISEIKDFAGNCFNDNVIFYTSFLSTEDIKELQTQYSIPIYSIQNDYLGFLAERENQYFIFRLSDNTLEVSRFHILDGDMKPFTSLYYRYCKRNI